MISNVALAWMLEEIIALENKEVEKNGGQTLCWKKDKVDALIELAKKGSEDATIHDALKFGGGWGKLGTLSWWLIG